MRLLVAATITYNVIEAVVAISALIIAVVAVKEGREAWRGDTCCAPIRTTTDSTSTTAADGCGDGCCAGRE